MTKGQCKACLHWNSTSWLCSHGSVGTVSKEDYRLENDSSIEPSGDHYKYCPLYPGPLFGCVHWVKHVAI